MKKQNVEIVVQVGLGVILVLLFLLAIVGMYQIRESNQSMSKIVQENLYKVKLAHEMRDSIRLREISMNKMLATDDPFERDIELIRFYEIAGIYRQARSKLLQLPMDVKEQNIHAKLTKATRVAQPLNNKAAELIVGGGEPEEIKRAVRVGSEQQQILLKYLNELVESQDQRAHEAIHHGTKQYDRSLFVVVIAGVFVIIGALLIVRKVSQYVASKNQELLEASQDALAANNTKSAFLATMSHEIRTPLTAIIGFAETSLDSNQTLKERISATKTIIHSGRHLLQIINDILDLSKIEADKLEIEELEMSLFELLNDIETIVKPLADEKELVFNIKYEFPIPKFIVSDPLRLKQIIINLVSNAIKFTVTGHVIVIVSFISQENMISFKVIDSGIGMTEQQMEKIFDAFTQADSSTTRKYGGTGLGLSLSKRLANQLGGDIVVQSLKNTGSLFELTVNAGHDIQFDFINNETEIPKFHNLEEHILNTDTFTGKILIAEDNENNQRLLTHIIKKLGASISIAENGKIAVTMATKESYDLILMDMQMPVLGGVDAIKQLRSLGYKKPIVALTANAMKKDKEDCLNAGCDDFLTKPIDRKELYRVITKYLPKYNAACEIGPKIESNLLKDERDFADLVEEYCIELPYIFKNIKQLASEKYWSKLNEVVHNLKGTGGGMGYPILTEIASKIEFQIENEDYAETNRLIVELGGIINRINL